MPVVPAGRPAEREWAATIPPVSVEIAPARPVVFDSHVDERARARVVEPIVERASAPKVSRGGARPCAGRSCTPTTEHLDALADCESGDHDGKPPYTYDQQANSGKGDLGPFQWKQRSWDGHVARLGLRHLVGVDPRTVDFETSREITRAVPLSAWPGQFPDCARKLGLA